MKKHLPRGISLFLFLFALWVIFSGYFKPFFLISGALSCLLTVYIAHRMNVVDHEGHPILVAFAPLTYWTWLAWQIIQSSLEVTWQVWHPRPKICPILAWIPDRQDSDLARVTYANSITLTPGTVCINVEEGRMQVHALKQESVDKLRKGEMARRVHDMIVKLELTE